MILFLLNYIFFSFECPVNVYNFYILFSIKDISDKFGILKAVTSLNLLRFRLSLRSVFHPYYTLKAFQSLILLCYKLRETKLGSADTKINFQAYNELHQQENCLTNRYAIDIWIIWIWRIERQGFYSWINIKLRLN